MKRRPLISLYYLGTPVFFLIDWLLGASVRVAALDGQPVLKYAYYLVCTIGGVAMLRRPAWADKFGLVESTFNILLLVLGVLTPIYRTIDALARQEAPTAVYSPGLVANFVIVAGMWLVTFYSNRFVHGQRFGR
jgi:hypothetical protein